MTNSHVGRAVEAKFDGISWSVLDHEVNRDPGFALLVRTYQPAMWAWYKQHGAAVKVFYDLNDAIHGSRIRVERSPKRAQKIKNLCVATVRLARIVDGFADRRCLRDCVLA